MTLRIRSTLAALALWPIASIALAQSPPPTAAPSAPVVPHTLDELIRKGRYEQIKISPGGEYYAATVRLERKTALAIVRREDSKVTAMMHIPGDQSIVDEFWWVSDTRLLLSAATQSGELEAPELTGDLYAINFDGTRGGILVGQSVQSEGPRTRIQSRAVEAVVASLLDPLPGSDDDVIIHVRPFNTDPYARAEKMDVVTGRRVTLATAPIRNAWFRTDNAGNVRFAWGWDEQYVRRLYHRPAAGGAWALVADDSKGGMQVPLGFSPDDRIAYLQVEMPDGPDAVVAWDVATGTRTEVARDDDVDPSGLYVNGVLHGVRFEDGLPRTQFFDPDSSMAKLQRKLERSFPGERVQITSVTRDGGLVMLLVDSDRSPGDYFIFDTKANRAERLLGLQEWIDPSRTAPMTPVSFKARDGLQINGLLTAPVGGEARNAPMVVLVHGGPFGIHDTWSFDKDAQILAAHGYAVLQVNYRGSGNRGAAFQEAGRRQWGGTMQDDLTDATTWAIAQGIADPARICIYGASYGGYASLMGVAKEPSLYRCAVGYVGAYDLEMMHTNGDIQRSASGEAYVEQWIGPRNALASRSPNRLAANITVPVFLAAGGLDERTPIEHTQRMEKALRALGKPVEAMYFPTEGHGFYDTDNERTYYTALLAFLARHIGGRTATPPTAAQAGGR